MLFAESDLSSRLFFLLWVAFLYFGATRAVKKIGGNPLARKAAAKGASHLIGRLFR